MTFENSIWLQITPLLILIAAALFFYGARRRDGLLGQFAAARLIGQLTTKASTKRLWIKSLCILVALASIGLALAQPQYGVEWSERKVRGLDLVFVLDSSKSMLATDLRPNRLARAKLAVVDLIEQLESDRIGLVAFAGRAFLQTPPTLDYAAFRESLDALGPSTMSRGGSDLGNALREAEKAFPPDNNFKAIILLTDGEDLGGDAIDAAQELAANAIKVYSIGIGTPAGEILRIRNRFGSETIVRDQAGNPVLTKLDEEALRQISQITDGSYSRLSAQSLATLYSSVLAILPRAEREAELQERRIERFQWLLAPAVILLILEMLTRRRGRSSIPSAVLLAGLGLALGLPQPAVAQVEPASEPTSNAPDHCYNHAYQALQAGDLQSAQALYQNTIRHSDNLTLQANALYNSALIDDQLARKSYEAGELKPALKKMQSAQAGFESVLEIDPEDPAAAADLAQVTAARKMIEQIIQQQEKEQDQQQQDQQQQEQDQQPGEDSESNNSDSQGQQTPADSQAEQNDEPADSQAEQNDEPADSDSARTEDQASQAASEDAPQDESTNNPTSNQAVPPTEDSPASAPAEAQAGNAAEAQAAMNEAEAQALLDSLRGGERILPLAAPRDSQNTNDLRDW